MSEGHTGVIVSVTTFAEHVIHAACENQVGLRLAEGDFSLLAD